MTRICVISAVGRISETPVRLWLETMREQGYDVTAVMPHSGPLEPWTSGIRVISLPSAPYLWPDAPFFRLAAVLIRRAVNSILLGCWLVQLRPQICVCSEPDAWLVAVILRSVLRMQVILYLREVFEDRLQSFPRMLRNSLSGVLRTILTRLSRHTDEIVHVSAARRAWYGYLTLPGTVIHHYPRLTPASSKVGSSRGIVLVHAGALRPTYGSEALIAGFEQAHAEWPALRLLVLGGIAGELQNAALVRELISAGALELKGQMPREQVLALLPACDIGIVHASDQGIATRLAEPTKLFEYLAAGLPVAASDVPTVRAIVRRWDCGVLFDASRPASIAQAILTLAGSRELRQRFSANAARAAREELNWEREQPKLVELLSGLAGRAGSQAHTDRTRMLPVPQTSK
jgi:glycosyltransferase involved in cell wall biosynthesis